MLRVVFFVLAFVAVVLVILVYRFRRRVERAAVARTQRRAVEAEARNQARKTGEVEYVIDRIQVELDRQAPAPDADRAGRLSELREVLARTFVIECEPLRVSGPCAEVIDAFRAEAEPRELLYSESGDGRWLHVSADRALLRWTVHEMFANVFQHAGDWSRISVLAEPVDGAILLTVRDDGRGLDRAAAARVYSPFTPRTGSRGPGLGLYAVRRIVETIGGSLEVRSTPNDGLVHRLRIPHPVEGPYGATSKTSIQRTPTRAESR